MPRADVRAAAFALALVAAVGCGAGASPPPTSAAPASPAAAASHAAPSHPAALEITVAYREAASVFEIVDNASAWYPDKNDAEYREHAVAALGFGRPEQELLDRWIELRRRTSPPAAETGGPLLGRDKPRDALAACFHAEADVAAALARVEAAFGRDAAAAARAVLEGLSPKLRPVLAEGRDLAPIAAALEAELRQPHVAAFARRMARFYGAPEVPRVTVVFVWWPPVESMTASLAGDTLLMRYHPHKHGEEARRDVDVVIHELAHLASRRQPEAQKAALSAAFSARCDAASKLAPARVLEEPLAVIHQKMFLAETAPARFDRSRSWYGDPWVSAMAKLSFDAAARAHADGRVLDEALVKAAAKACHELAGAGRALAR
ncbi:MAG: hypothetical protein JNL38_40405 [Myxococcales bacterium]|nr:hypothetical protein [Myxococcales bacterium]